VYKGVKRSELQVIISMYLTEYVNRPVKTPLMVVSAVSVVTRAVCEYFLFL